MYVHTQPTARHDRDAGEQVRALVPAHGCGGSAPTAAPVHRHRRALLQPARPAQRLGAPALRAVRERRDGDHAHEAAHQGAGRGRAAVPCRARVERAVPALLADAGAWRQVRAVERADHGRQRPAGRWKTRAAASSAHRAGSRRPKSRRPVPRRPRGTAGCANRLARRPAQRAWSQGSWELPREGSGAPERQQLGPSPAALPQRCTPPFSCVGILRAARRGKLDRGAEVDGARNGWGF